MDVKRETRVQREITHEYIRGLVEGEGSFTFSSSGHRKIPSFQIRMHIRDKVLLEKMRDFLKLRNRIYTYHYPGKDNKRGPQAVLIVREFGNLKNIIIPLFYESLIGHKSSQFADWLEKIGSDSSVPQNYKLLYRLHKSGFYSRNKIKD